MKDRHITNLNLSKDYDSFEELSVLSFGKNVNQDFKMQQWLFDLNPYNPDNSNLMYILKEDNKVIAADGLFPFQLYVNGKTYNAAHSIKSMTHPEYKRQGIFTDMTRNSEDKAKENNIDIIIGLANKNSFPAYEKFCWDTLFEKTVFIRPVNITRKLKSKLKITFLAKGINKAYQLLNKAKMNSKSSIKKAGLNVKITDKVPEEAALCWDKYKDKYHVTTVRDFKYLNYRYNMRPDVGYKTITLYKDSEPVGYVILREAKTAHSKMVTVAENFTDPQNEIYIGALAESIINFCLENNDEYAVSGTGSTGKFDKVFTQYGFMRNKGHLSNNMMIANILNPEINIEDITGYENWHLTQGDGETELDI